MECEKHINVCPQCGRFVTTNECWCHHNTIDTGYTYDEYKHICDSGFTHEKDFERKMRELYTLNSPDFNEALYNETIELEEKEHRGLLYFWTQEQLELPTDQRLTKQEMAKQYVPKCPTCGSADVQKIGSIERGASILTFGFFSRKINKSFKCNNCKYTW